MKQARFRFYADLNDFLPAVRRETSFIQAFRNRASVKDMIEALGIPHTEVGAVLVGGEPVDFSHVVQNGDHISVYRRGNADPITYQGKNGKQYVAVIATDMVTGCRRSGIPSADVGAAALREEGQGLPLAVVGLRQTDSLQNSRYSCGSLA